MKSMFKDNLEQVRENIRKAAMRAGRNEKDVTLIAVSKTHPVSAIEELVKLGQLDFGENKVQELMSKMPNVSKDVNWHLIGHLQTNKVKYVVGNVKLIHSVDSLKLAQEISKQSVKKNLTTDILLEVNVAGEESKFGFTADEVHHVIHRLNELPNIKVKGLMTVAPYVENPEENRPVFRELCNLSVDIRRQKLDNISIEILSMGMSNDYEVAIEEGSNMVRVGTALFGTRNYL